MKLITWNVNGLRSVMQKGFETFMQSEKPDIISIQETKMQESQKTFSLDGYYEFWSDAEKKGYSGTLIYTKHQPLSVTYGIEGKYTDEGRVITLAFEDFYLINTYVPNVKRDLSRIPYRQVYEADLLEYVKKLDAIKPVIHCGDLNVAHEEIDIKNAKANKGNAGFTDEERECFSTYLQSGFSDVFRTLYPQKEQYTWWSYQFQARTRNVGWRIDYFITSERFMPWIKDCYILDNVLGSDHCPVVLTLHEESV